MVRQCRVILKLDELHLSIFLPFYNTGKADEKCIKRNEMKVSNKLVCPISCPLKLSLTMLPLSCIYTLLMDFGALMESSSNLLIVNSI